MEEQCLGIDWGEARIGLALGNSAWKIASPLSTVATLEEIETICAKEQIQRLVVGQPVGLDGSHPDRNEPFNAFLEALKRRVPLPLTLVDERLSSKAADSLDPSARREGRRDQIAAMLILQSYFDTL